MTVPGNTAQPNAGSRCAGWKASGELVWHKMLAMKTMIILCFLLAGCALRPAWHWERAGAGEAEYRRDEIACKQQSYEGADGAVTQAHVRRMQSCLETRGWRKVAH